MNHPFFIPEHFEYRWVKKTDDDCVGGNMVHPQLDNIDYYRGIEEKSIIFNDMLFEFVRSYRIIIMFWCDKNIDYLSDCVCIDESEYYIFADISLGKPELEQHLLNSSKIDMESPEAYEFKNNAFFHTHILTEVWDKLIESLNQDITWQQFHQKKLLNQSLNANLCHQNIKDIHTKI